MGGIEICIWLKDNPQRRNPNTVANSILTIKKSLIHTWGFVKKETYMVGLWEGDRFVFDLKKLKDNHKPQQIKPNRAQRLY